jgi:predicted GH43/DUF377 family glycosyl hydrolase
MLHRPLFPGTRPEEAKDRRAPLAVEQASIWISYCPKFELCHFTSHHRLAAPIAAWERLKIGVGAPPVLTPHGWLLTYHGVGENDARAPAECRFRYSAGLMLLDGDRPHRILYRSSEPVLSPEEPHEHSGTIGDIVFPTGIDRRDDLGTPQCFDLYYGRADHCIGAARLDLRVVPPRPARGDPPGSKL